MPVSYTHLHYRALILRKTYPEIVALALVHEVGQLRVGLTEDERPVVGDVHLPQRLDDEGLSLIHICTPLPVIS